MEEENPFNFTVGMITPDNMRPGGGLTIKTPVALTQQLAAVSAYNSFDGTREWPSKLALAYVVALTTRSADQKIMLLIQRMLNTTLKITCKRCLSASIGEGVIRERLFPDLKKYREAANALVHHLDDPDCQGLSGLDIEAVFKYCKLLFIEKSNLNFGSMPDPTGKFPFKACKKCAKP